MTYERARSRSVLTRGLDKAQRVLADAVYTPLGRPVTVATVKGRSDVGSIRRSHVRDFTLGFPQPARCLDLAVYTPFFADYPRGLLHLVRTDPSGDATRAFFYMAQREFADRVATVSFDRLDELRTVGFEQTARPILIFSIGRCGSTLLSKLLATSGIASFSELDVFSQVEELTGGVGRRFGHSEARIRAFRDRVIGTTLEALQARARSDRICVKMRSAAARAFPQIAETCPRADVVFLFRGVEGWARSWISALGFDVDKMVATLEACVAAVDHATAHGRAHTILWYEDLSADPLAACARITGQTGDPVALGQVMAEDSQHNSGLAARTLQDRRLAQGSEIDAQTAQFLKAWHTAQPVERLRRLGLAGLIV